MADPLAQFPMLGSGFSSQLVSNPNAAAASQQQQPSDSMQSIGGLPNPEHSRMWMQMQQQINQQRTTSAGDIVGSQVTLNSSFPFHFPLPFFSTLSFSPRFLSSHCNLAPALVSPPLQTPPSNQSSRLTCSGLLTSAVSFVTFLLTLPPSLTNSLANSQLIFLCFRWSVSNSYSVHPFLWGPVPTYSMATCSVNFKTTEPSTR